MRRGHRFKKLRLVINSFDQFKIFNCVEIQKASAQFIRILSNLKDLPFDVSTRNNNCYLNCIATVFEMGLGAGTGMCGYMTHLCTFSNVPPVNAASGLLHCPASVTSDIHVSLNGQNCSLTAEHVTDTGVAEQEATSDTHAFFRNT